MDALSKIFLIVLLVFFAGIALGDCSSVSAKSGAGTIPQSHLVPTASPWDRCKPFIRGIFQATYRYGDRRDSPLFYLAQLMQESRCNTRAKSHAGAQGLLQIMPATAREIAQKWGEGTFDPWTAGDNIRAGIWYDQRTRKFWDPKKRSYCDRLMLMLSGYNAGNGWWLKAQKKCALDRDQKDNKNCNSYYGMARFFPKVNPHGARENLNYVRIISRQHDLINRQNQCERYDATNYLTP